MSADHPEDSGRTDRWQSLVAGAFLLEETLTGKEGAGGGAGAIPPTLSYLDNLLEVFPSSLDPVEDFEGYAVRRMVLALRRALEQQGGR
ncbi:hypothetical protein [Vitiosangium sp. GDMCC 1.1324]|uniref:hypothetical protein n=1 Tax=Vitiosangium sp. (strain GDMCC 1.1324) TaxID=2138576 RepID=UPI000D3CA93E|nr:hypothetical protein [Vitiosangium sp. GDMCC 1.1324]PTL79422.1 hypothetical protein DAT35_35110 [Vitiosangium sp. GDMCC 1.1324]